MAEIKNKKIFITGGAGFIASHLISRLVRRNRIFVYDILDRTSLLKTGLQKNPNVKLIKGDVLDKKRLRRYLKNMDIVIHMASIAGVDQVLEQPVRTMEVNLLGTHNVGTVALENCPNLSHFMDFSTSEVFGAFAYKVSEGDVTSLGAVGESRWTYAVSKIAMEHYLFNLHKAFGFPVISIRPFNIYGPNQSGVGAIKTFIQRAVKNQKLKIHNDGSQIRAWCYVDDMVDALINALSHRRAVGHALNIGNPSAAITIYQLAVMIKRLSGSSSVIENVPWRKTEVELRIPSIDQAQRLLKWSPKTDLESGLVSTIEYYRDCPGKKQG